MQGRYGEVRLGEGHGDGGLHLCASGWEIMGQHCSQRRIHHSFDIL